MSLVKIDYTGKSGTIFECDRCHKKIDTDKDVRYIVDISKSKLKDSGRIKIKKYDFCDICIKKWLKEGE